MEDEDDMQTEHCRVGVYHKMAMDASEKMEDEQGESTAEEAQEKEE